MIVSHKNKFIFIKTEKTAGTSLEIALSKQCGPEDVITPITPEDEAKRRAFGYRGPQNYRIPLRKYSLPDVFRAVQTRRPLTYFNHASAAFVMKYLNRETWDSYFKFCYERNPWDKAISWYYWKCKDEPRPSISDFIQSGEANKIRGFDLYTRESELLVDKVFKYEELGDTLQEICDRTGLDEVPSLPRTKAHYRKDKRNYREILSEPDKEKISKVFAREIAYFDYEW